MVPFVENPQTHSFQTFETKRDGARGPLVCFLIVSRDRCLFEFLSRVTSGHRWVLSFSIGRGAFLLRHGARWASVTGDAAMTFVACGHRHGVALKLGQNSYKQQ